MDGHQAPGQTLPSIGQKFGKYEIVEELGRGAMGVVYKARDPLIGRMVALKTVMPGLLADGDLLKRFYREAQSAGRLQHPNIVTIHDLGESDGLPYISMELVEGESLQKIIARRAPLPLASRLKIVQQICSGLGHAHRNGVVHRDIKPANILVAANGTVKVVDFGIVHLADTGMTHSGMIIGTVSYMSPEQLRGEHVDARSDIFSVGIVMYELLAYRRAFEGTATSVMLKIASEEPTPLVELVPGLPSALEDVVLKCLRKDRAERYSTLEDLAFEIDPFARRMQREVVDGLVEQSRELLARNEFLRAEEVLRNALAMDSSHDAAQSLMSKAQTELRRLKSSVRTQQFMDEGRQLLEQNKYSEAAKAFEEVLRLDSHHGQARDLLEKARAAATAASEVRKRLGAAKRALSEGELTSAESELRRALEVDAGQLESAELLEKIRHERAVQERRVRLRDGLTSARELIRTERYDEAQAQLRALQRDFPAESETDELLALATQKIEEREQIKEAFNEIKSLLEQQKFPEAMDRAETVRFQFPKDSESTRIYNFARAESGLAERRQRLELEVTELQELVREQRYNDAISLGERIKEEFPGSVEVARLMRLARSEQQAADRLERFERARKSIEALWTAGDLEEAKLATENALREFPGEPSLVRMQAALNAEIARRAAPARPVESFSMESLINGGAPKPGAPELQWAESPATSVGMAPVSRSIRLPLESTSPIPSPAPQRKRSMMVPTVAALLILGLIVIGFVILHPHPTAVPVASAASLQPASYTSAADPNPSQTSSGLGPSSSNAPSGTEPAAPALSPPTEAVRSAASSPPRTRSVDPTVSKPVSARSPGAASARGGGTGELVVTANVEGAEILIDAHDSGEATPHTFSDLPAGTHTVSLMKTGYSPTSGRFDVTAGGSATANLQISPPTGLLEFVTTPPGAAVSIDGKEFGNTPIKITIAEGSHTFTVTLGTQSKTGTLTVHAEGYTQKQVDFSQ